MAVQAPSIEVKEYTGIYFFLQKFYSPGRVGGGGGGGVMANEKISSWSKNSR